MGHYYSRTGEPMHFCGPNGSPTTLREARKLGLVPSVTEVLQIISRPGFERWKREQSVLSALTLPRLPDEDSASLLDRIDADASRQAKEAADEGTAIHAAIEASFRSEAVPARLRPHVSAVRQILTDNFPGVSDWVVEHRFASPAGFGGCVDIHSRSANVIGDHKSTAIGPDQTKQLAFDQFWQLGAYAEGLGMPADCRGFNIFISRTHPGHVRFHLWTPDKMRQGRLVFMDTLRLWRSMKAFT